MTIDFGKTESLIEMISVNDCSISVMLGKMQCEEVKAMSTKSYLNCFIVKGSRYWNDNWGLFKRWVVRHIHKQTGMIL